MEEEQKDEQGRLRIVQVPRWDAEVLAYKKPSKMSAKRDGSAKEIPSYSAGEIVTLQILSQDPSSSTGWTGRVVRLRAR